MSDENPSVRPRLRYIDIFPVPEEQGRQAFAIRDPQHFSDKVLRLRVEAACALQFFDGTRTLPEIQAAYEETYKVEFPLPLLEQLCEVLDDGYFLASDNFDRYFQRLAAAFREAPVREPFHAGISYDENPAVLKESLGQLFVPPEGPGLPGERDPRRRIPGIVVPHIDLRLGGHAYAWAYKELAEAAPPELVVILGTGHNGTENPYALTCKRFATPLGEVPVEAEFVSRLRALHGGELFADELAHRSEHTIEFQVLFIQQLFGNSTPIVPVLCSFSHADPGRGPAGDSIERFIAALRTAIAEDGRRVCLIASADLAHVGPRYGDANGFEGEELEAVKRSDREMLRHVEQVDAEGFRDYLAREQDRRRICGFSPIYTMLRSMQADGGRLVAHDHGEMDPIGSICSFASVVFE
ncbi:MAG: AmmeMemoRadiSam system protein B [Deltaproteobacteria bacterium]|nr:AmmeMemoRadiSam system protein B [Deltaproteobacteria bacterium]